MAGSSARNIAFTSIGLRSGLARKSDMPASRHSLASSGKALAVSAMIGSEAKPRERIDLVAAKPSMTGICTSISTISYSDSDTA